MLESADTPSLMRIGKRRQIKDSITHWMRRQRLVPGDRLPGQDELAGLFGTTPLTVHRAMTELAQEGIVRREPRRGTFVGDTMRSPRTRQICLVLPGDHLDEPAYNPVYWPYMHKLLRAFLDAVRDGWVLSTRIVEPGTPFERSASDFAMYDGVFFHWVRQPYDLLRYLIEQGTAPVIAFGQPAADLPCLTLDHDARAGSRKAIAYLLGLGYRRIALVASDQSWGEFWLDGYRRALADFELPFDPIRVVRVGETQSEGLRAAVLLQHRGLPCDAVFAESDLHALGVIEGFRQGGLRVPEDMGVMGYDGLDIAVHHPPYLTSLDVPHKAMIEAALKMLADGDGGPTEHRHLAFEGNVLPGGTTAARGAGLDYTASRSHEVMKSQ